MNKQTKQSGFAHLGIIVAIVTLALIGALGFIFWQNFMQQKTKTIDSTRATANLNNNKTTDIDSSQISLTEVVEDQTSVSGLSIKYPESWVNNHSSSVNDGPSDTNTITSPDGGVKITMQTNLGGLGGTCNFDDLGVITSLDESPIVGLDGYSFVAANIQYNDGKYSFLVGVESNNTRDYNRKLTVGDGGCVLGLGIIRNSDGNSSVTVDFPKDTLFNITLPEINDFKSTDNYKIAKRILESLSY